MLPTNYPNMSQASEIKKVYTITYSEMVENHARMQQIGTMATKGYSTEQMRELQDTFPLKVVTEWYDLGAHWPGEEKIDAAVLVIRKGVQYLLETEDTKALMTEHDSLAMDKHAKMKGRVVNKHARWNLCFADFDQEPNYEDGKGRVIDYKHIPLTAKIREKIGSWLKGSENLNSEANYYYDISKCGISAHGDSERRTVIGVRMGEKMPLYFHWFQHSEPVGERIKVDLGDGDMYIMSEKAVGTDWMKKKIPTLRHATGCDKYTLFKPKVKKERYG